MDDITNVSRQTANLSGPNYALPLSATQEVVRYLASNDWTATFSSLVPGLLLYASGWRGLSAGIPTATYTFDQPVTLLSGTGGTLTGNTLSVPNSANFNGILQFTNPVSTFNVTSNVTSGSATNNTTFATPVPLETDALPVVVGAAFMAGGVWWKKKRAQAKVTEFVAKK